MPSSSRIWLFHKHQIQERNAILAADPSVAPFCFNPHLPQHQMDLTPLQHPEPPRVHQSHLFGGSVEGEWSNILRFFLPLQDFLLNLWSFYQCKQQIYFVIIFSECLNQPWKKTLKIYIYRWKKTIKAIFQPIKNMPDFSATSRRLARAALGQSGEATRRGGKGLSYLLVFCCYFLS